jgi:hypothetical protein
MKALFSTSFTILFHYVHGEKLHVFIINLDNYGVSEPLRMLYLHSGQVAWIRSHLIMHVEWKWWLHGSAHSSIPSSYVARQMQHSYKHQMNNEKVCTLIVIDSRKDKSLKIKRRFTASSRRRMRSPVEVPLLFRIGTITPSSAVFSPLSDDAVYLYLGSILRSASDAPSCYFRTVKITQ